MALSLRINVPPNQSTIIIIIVPRNSLIGWANAWRVDTLAVFLLTASVMLSKRLFIFFSAMKALMTRSPPRVSSTCDMVSLQRFWASRERFLSCLPMAPMAQAITGTTRMVKRVSSQLVKIRVPK